MINARAETVAEKPSFRAAFKRRRCLIPASGFYEWRQGEKGKQPYFIGPAETGENAVLALGGLWETWVSPDGSEIDSCTILTTEPNALMADLHNRMPLILAPEDFAEWLGRGVEEPPRQLDAIRHLLRPYAAEKMHAYPVSTYVNNARNEGRECIAPVAEQ
jgi:putative SOS response-associated peptidase YedK